VAARNLNACPGCSIQYDVSALDAGTLVRCACSAEFEVRTMLPKTMRALRCSNCGGNLRDGAQACEYCLAEVTLDELRLDSICPLCCARMASDARFCMNCGVSIAPQPVSSAADRTCPRCRTAMHERRVGNFSVTECGSCAGLWLQPGDLERLTEHAEDDPDVVALIEGVSRSRKPGKQHPHGYLPCAECGQMMVPRNFSSRSGTVYDWCKDHGLWLDHRELGAILRFVKDGGMVLARRDKIRRLEAETVRVKSQRQSAVEMLSMPMAPLHRNRHVLGMHWLSSLIERIFG